MTTSQIAKKGTEKEGVVTRIREWARNKKLEYELDTVEGALKASRDAKGSYDMPKLAGRLLEDSPKITGNLIDKFINMESEDDSDFLLDKAVYLGDLLQTRDASEKAAETFERYGIIEREAGEPMNYRLTYTGREMAYAYYDEIIASSFKSEIGTANGIIGFGATFTAMGTGMFTLTVSNTAVLAQSVQQLHQWWSNPLIAWPVVGVGGIAVILYGLSERKDVKGQMRDEGVEQR